MSPLHRLLRPTALLLALVVTAMLVQQQWGLPGVTETLPLDPGDPEIETDGFALRLRLPEHQRRVLVQERYQLLRDGMPWGIKARSNAYVRDRGNGRFRIRGNYLRFSTAGNLPLAESPHRYSLRLPRVVEKPHLAVALALLFLAAACALAPPAGKRPRPAVSGSSRPPPSPSTEALAVFLLALAVRLVVLFCGVGLDSGGLVVNGMPYSDGIGWNELAISLKEGRGITGSFFTHRPYYGFFLGSWYALLGNHLVIAKLVNVFAGALGTALVYLLVRAAFRSRILGFAIASLIGFSVRNLEWVHLTVTEDVGFAFTLLSLYLLWAAYDLKKGRVFLLAGLFFGLANLTRTLTLLAAPLYLLPLLPFLPASWRDRSAWKRALLHGGLFTLGVFLVFAPWIARQKIQYGFLTISSNSADLLYAAAHPDLGRWNTSIYEEAIAAGAFDNITDRTAFFQRRLKEIVSEDPARYLQSIASNARKFVEAFAPTESALFRLTASLAMLGMAIALSLRHRSALALLALALLFPLWGWMGRVPNLVLLPLATALCLLRYRDDRRALHALAIVASTLVACIAMSALIGDFGHLRSAPFVWWMDALLLLLAMAASLGALTGIFTTAKRRLWALATNTAPASAPTRSPELPSWNRFAAVTTWFLVAFCALGLLNIGLRTLLYQDPTPYQLKASEVTRTLGQIGQQLGDPADLARRHERGDLFLRPVIVDTYSCQIAADEDVDHWSRLFEIRDYDRTVALGRVGLDPGVRDHPLRSLQIHGTPSPGWMGRPLVVVGMENVEAADRVEFGHEERIVEVLAIFPLDPQSGRVDLSTPLVASPTREALALLR